MSTPVCSPHARIAALEAELAATRGQLATIQNIVSGLVTGSAEPATKIDEDETRKKPCAKKARIDSSAVSNSAAASVVASNSAKKCVVPMPVINHDIRANESKYLQRLAKDGPVIVHFKLFDAVTNGLRHEIPAVICEDGTFSYLTRDETYLSNLHSFEIMWHIRCDYALSGEVDYEQLMYDGRYLHCLKFAFLEDQHRHSIQKTVHSMINEDRASHSSTRVAKPILSEARALTPPTPTRTTTVASTPPTKRRLFDPKACPPPIERRVYRESASNSSASNSSASNSSASNSSASNSSASNSSASNSSASNSSPSRSRHSHPMEDEILIIPPTIWRNGIQDTTKAPTFIGRRLF